jgi:acyl-CoA synthetase (AMP-forming)/AMP-acid ligase II
MLPGVASSAAVSVPDEKMGEAVGVFISKHKVQDADAVPLTPALVRAHVKEHLSGPSAPDWVWFMGEGGVASEWPTTASGKVQKIILRQWAKELHEEPNSSARAKKA